MFQGQLKQNQGQNIEKLKFRFFSWFNFNFLIESFTQTQDCIDSKSWNSLRRKALRGHYWVLYNHVKATETFECLDSITYTTHGEFKYLQNNLANVIKRWKGPLSMAIYSPGSDYEKAMKTIYYYRECTEDSPMIKALATFHLFFHVDHMPKTLNVNKNLTCNDFEDPQEWTSYR